LNESYESSQKVQIQLNHPIYNKVDNSKYNRQLETETTVAEFEKKCLPEYFRFDREKIFDDDKVYYNSNFSKYKMGKNVKN